ncbi:alpha/beta fold hydrolase [Microtetraspora fusca]|uniref:alpha/beta fold hydrolase n=1 Tax=Microtetraspora fusca TaxID=1997 RepID=UPI001FE03304|nr:alpha/beta fold hydrolase [Microtetraspora fusca]
MTSSLALVARLEGETWRAGASAAAKIRGWAGDLTAAPSGLLTPCGDGLCGPASATATCFVEARPEGLPPITLAYERHGSGEPVVLLHGIGSHRQAWDPIVPLLMAEHTVITVDLPGFGDSPDLPRGLSRDLPTMVTELGAMFTALGLDLPHVAGHSLGGLIALRLAQAGLVRSVTALAPAGFWTEAERRYAFAVLSAARNIARLPSWMVSRLAATPIGRAALTGTLYGRPDRCPPGEVVTSLAILRQSVAFNATLRAGRAPDLFVGDIPGVPVTIAWGSADRVLFARQAARAAATIPGAHMVWLPGCGHVPMNDAPALVARVILDATRPSGLIGVHARDLLLEGAPFGAEGIKEIADAADGLPLVCAESLLADAAARRCPD